MFDVEDSGDGKYCWQQLTVKMLQHQNIMLNLIKPCLCLSMFMNSPYSMRLGIVWR